MGLAGIAPAYAAPSHKMPTEESTPLAATTIQLENSGTPMSANEIAAAIEDTNSMTDQLAISVTASETPDALHSASARSGSWVDDPQYANVIRGATWAGNPTLTFDGVEYRKTVGKLFSTAHEDNGDTHSWACTATVITSATKSMLITAAHCIWPKDYTSPVTDSFFVPAYHKDASGTIQMPFGQWPVVAATAHDDYIDASQRADHLDQAFLKVGPRVTDGAYIQDVVGAEGLTVGGPLERGVTTDPWCPETNPECMPPLESYSYPEGQDHYYKPDAGRVYKCIGTSVAMADFDIEYGIQMPCGQPITGGASGSSFIEHGQSGSTVIGTFFGREAILIEVEKLDDNGDPITDANGDPVTEEIRVLKPGSPLLGLLNSAKYTGFLLDQAEAASSSNQP